MALTSVSHVLLVTYDIASDSRRSDVSDLLSACGARVQQSVFEVEFATKAQVRGLIARLRRAIDRDEDQIRIYPLDADALNRCQIMGLRRLEERADYWIV